MREWPSPWTRGAQLVLVLTLAGCTRSTAPQGSSETAEPVAAPVTVATSTPASSDATAASATQPPSADALSVTALRAKAPKPGPEVHRLSGYVVKIYSCPPCPAGAQCKPCMGDNIVISDDATLHELYDLDDRDVIVFTSDTKAFELGKRVTISVRVMDRQQSNKGIHDLELVE